MKRLPFKPQFLEAILSGRKTATLRPNPLGLKAGDVVAFVLPLDGKPAWLTKAEDRFALGEITAVRCGAASVLIQEALAEYERFGFKFRQDAVEFYAKSFAGRQIGYICEFKVVGE